MRYHSTSLAAFHNASKCNSVKCLQHHRGLDCGHLHGVASEGTLIATVSIIKAASNTNTRVTTEPHKYDNNEIAVIRKGLAAKGRGLDDEDLQSVQGRKVFVSVASTRIPTNPNKS